MGWSSALEVCVLGVGTGAKGRAWTRMCPQAIFPYAFLLPSDDSENSGSGILC